MRALVLAHGNGDRWHGHLGGPKQLVVEVDGEAVLARTVRQLRDRDVAPVLIVAPDERFALGAPVVSLANPFPTGCDQDKFFATAHLWNPHGRTTIFWGDCYYTDQAMDMIVAHNLPGLHYFRRPWPSTLTGHAWDESFAVTFTPDTHPHVLAAAARVTDLWARGLLRATHIRTHYAAALGFADHELDDVARLVDTPHQTVVDDWTDDFDRPEDYERWQAAWSTR